MVAGRDRVHGVDDRAGPAHPRRAAQAQGRRAGGGRARRSRSRPRGTLAALSARCRPCDLSGRPLDSRRGRFTRVRAHWGLTAPSLLHKVCASGPQQIRWALKPSASSQAPLCRCGPFLCASPTGGRPLWLPPPATSVIHVMELDLAMSGRRQPMCSTRVLDLRSGRHARRRRFINAALIVVSLAAVALVAQGVTLPNPPAADGRPHLVAPGRATGACWLVKVTSGIAGDHRILAKARAILRRAGLPAEIWPATPCDTGFAASWSCSRSRPRRPPRGDGCAPFGSASAAPPSTSHFDQSVDRRGNLQTAVQVLPDGQLSAPSGFLGVIAPTPPAHVRPCSGPSASIARLIGLPQRVSARRRT